MATTLLVAAIIAASALAALAEVQRKNHAILGALQPHSVRTALHALPADEAKFTAPVKSRPQDICLGQSASVEASIAACNAVIQRRGVAGASARPVYRRRAEAFSQNGDIDAAIADYDRAIKLDPRKADSYVGRGRAHLARHETDLAIQDFNRAIRLEPRNAEAIFERAKTHRVAGDTKSVLSDYDFLIRLNPRDTEAYYRRGMVRRELQAYDLALEDFDRVTELDRDSERGYYSRGLVLYEMHQYESAIRAFDQAINIKPDYAPAFNARGSGLCRDRRDAARDPGFRSGHPA
jgi:tetratricopeptide (TPR) repeat protein